MFYICLEIRWIRKFEHFSLDMEEILSEKDEEEASENGDVPKNEAVSEND